MAVPWHNNRLDMVVQVPSKLGEQGTAEAATSGLRLKKNSGSDPSPVKLMDDGEEPLRNNRLPMVKLDESSPVDSQANRLDTCLPNKDFNLGQFSQECPLEAWQRKQEDHIKRDFERHNNCSSMSGSPERDQLRLGKTNSCLPSPYLRCQQSQGFTLHLCPMGNSASAYSQQTS